MKCERKSDGAVQWSSPESGTHKIPQDWAWGVFSGEQFAPSSRSTDQVSATMWACGFLADRIRRMTVPLPCEVCGRVHPLLLQNTEFEAESGVIMGVERERGPINKLVSVRLYVRQTDTGGRNDRVDPIRTIQLVTHRTDYEVDLPLCLEQMDLTASPGHDFNGTMHGVFGIEARPIPVVICHSFNSISFGGRASLIMADKTDRLVEVSDV